MKHEEMMKNDEEYRKHTGYVRHEMSFEKIVEVVVKSNRIVGVGVISLKEVIETQLNDLMRGY